MADVKWIKFKVGTFDGASFKRIKKAKLADGTSYRDRLTAIWFELLDLAGKNNLDGKLVDSKELELPFDFENQYQDIATMIDREPEEVKCALVWFIKNRMIEVIDNVYCLSNWCKYQSIRTIDDVREQNRIRNIAYRARKKQQKIEENAKRDITMTSNDAPRNKNKEIEEENKNKKEEIELDSSRLKATTTPTLKEIEDYIKEKNYKVNAKKFYDVNEARGWKIANNEIINWKYLLAIWNTKEVKGDITLEDWQIEGMKGIMEDFKNENSRIKD